MSETSDDRPHYTIILALGSNMGDRAAALRTAVEKLAPYVTITAKSKIYETPSAYASDQPDYLNAVVMGTTKLEPLTLLWVVKDLESEIGRLPTYRYGPRVIDIDIVDHSIGVLTTTELSIPHARLRERDFVLKPLCDIAPDWQHPADGKTAREFLNACVEINIKDTDEQW